jgi:glyoxylase-like metal-dependent hydrolase (beta-lactamase superfamily II)
VRLIPLDLGRIEASLRVVTGEDGTVSLPIIGWLIEHRNGLAMFDNGMHRGLQTDTTRLGRTAKAFKPVYNPGDEVAAQLERRGVRPSDIDIMIFSHLHFDHAGGTCDLPDARLVVQDAEWRAGQDDELVEAGVYDPVDYDHGHEVQTVEGEHDVFGDGTVMCLPTPGHTVGHQALRVELESGPVVLTGDCVYFERMLTEMLVPRFGYDTDQQRRSMKRLSTLQSDGCRLLFGHDEAQFQGLPVGGLT